MSAARRLDWLLIAVVCLLALLGCIAIARAAQLELASSSFLTRQGIWVAASAVAMVVTARTNYRVIGRWNCELMVLAMALLVAVYLFPPVNGARRWIRFGPVSVQPSEFAKLAYVLVLARYLMYRESYRRLPGLLAP